jgi:biopolymer transport protein ExbD
MAASTYAPRLHDGSMAEMNVTPLVDVMLVLLVFFMITAPALTRALPMNLPQPREGTPPPPAQMHLRVGAGGSFLLDGHALDAAGLRAALAEAGHLSPAPVLHVSAAGDSEYQGFATALDAAQAAGLGNITLD